MEERRADGGVKLGESGEEGEGGGAEKGEEGRGW